MSSQQLARSAACVALLAVGSWVSIPLGPVPFTLQTLVLAMLPFALTGWSAAWTVAVYLILGAIGLPVFSSMNGGIGVLAGPTGGYLWGFFIGMVLAILVRDVKQLPEVVRAPLSLAVLLVVAYALGTVQFCVVTGSEPVAALLLCVVPFIVPDVVKMAAGAVLGMTVRRALSRSHHAMV